MPVRPGACLIGAAEVTQREFEGVMGFNPAHHKGPDLPVENVTWWDAIRYCNLRSAREGFEACYNLATGACDTTRNGYRLPTEAEWTAAAGPIPEAARIREFANLGSENTKDTRRLAAELARAGTRPAGSLLPNPSGLYDMLGIVWEWCNDYFNAADSPQRSRSPAGPLRGVARVIRGGGYLSTTARWARGYRSSMEPGYRSPYLGFRVCRTAPSFKATAAFAPGWEEPYHRIPPGFENATGPLPPLPRAASPAEWERVKADLRKKWKAILGAPSVTPPPPAVRLVETHTEPNYLGQLMYLQVEPDWWEKIYLLTPEPAPARPLPVVIVPYYDVDVPVGKNLGGKVFRTPAVHAFAPLAAQRGCIAVAMRWWGESYGEGYSEAVANLLARHPGVTGMGKWVWDAARLLDYLATLSFVDSRRIGIMGHSLGAKMTLYAMAMDERIGAGVFSEGGIGLTYSNYEDYWYLGEKAGALPAGTDHHELLALIAPRPFLMIGGESADNDRSWHYVNAARPVYELFRRPLHIGYFNHRSGHSPTPEAVRLAMDWMERFLVH